MLNKSLNLNPKIFSKDIEKASTRDGFGEGLLAAGELDENVVALCADLEESTRVENFKERFPDRFFEVGVAEQALVTIASGLANYGKIPFATSFAVFSPGRNWEQIRTTICLNDVPVKLVGSHTGLSVGEDGATHQMLEDIALMRALPNMTVVVPADAIQAKKTTLALAKTGKPAYLRLTRQKSPVITTPDTEFELGKTQILWEAKDPLVSIIASGPLVYEALLAAQKLSKSKIASIVVNLHTVKPIDEQGLIHAAKLTGCVVTVEDHQIAAGIGSVVAECLTKNYPVPIEFIGVDDQFGQSGSSSELIKKYNLDAAAIISAAKRVIRRKNS
jgi:transketolase